MTFPLTPSATASGSCAIAKLPVRAKSRPYPLSSVLSDRSDFHTMTRYYTIELSLASVLLDRNTLGQRANGVK